MPTFEEKLQQDRDWLRGLMNDFEVDAVNKEGVSDIAVASHKLSFESFVMETCFGENASGKRLEKSSYTNFNAFEVDAEEEKENKEKIRTKKNLLALWEKYLADLDLKNDEARECLRRAMMIRINFMRGAPETLMSYDIEKYAPINNGYRLVAGDKNPRRASIEFVERPRYGGFGGPEDGADSSKFYVFKPSYVNSGIIAGFAGLATGAVAGALMRSASNIAICSAIGAFGLTGFPALLLTAAGVAVTGAAVGVATGSIRSAMKNHEAIGAAIDDVEWTQKPQVWLKAFGKSLDRKQLLGNALFGAVGGGLGFGLTHIAELTACLSDQFGWVSGSDKLSYSNVKEVFGLPDQAVMQPQVSAPRMDGIGDSFDYDDLKEKFGLSGDDVNHNLDATQNSDICPKYIEGCAGSEYLIVYDVEYGNMPVDQPEQTAVQENPSSGVETAQPSTETITTVIAPTDTAPIMPDSDMVVVKAGDNLTHIIEREYNVQEGSEHFDRIMSEVARANGLDGVEQNWLKVNWELAMPSVPADAADALNRAALDANWRAGDVTFSDVPHFAPAA